MVTGFENIQKLGKDNMDIAMQSFGVFSKGMQAISAEVADYSKKSIEESNSAIEKVVSAKSIDKAMEAQADFAKASYENMVGQATKIGEMYAEVAKDAYKPYENMLTMTAK
ncbi:Phasin protein [Pseudovibrio axinellae]|uniref:Phasin protein n=1 Tax=Pseudovibrio axinellae TaxID=989403 RepID=A0A165TWN4_9HYPH|nr:phasin family protein [Pseudovibrio axinellae]KZL06731.1 Phasin protein [Pseudovibrio axinellae]SER62172.1 phasin family protein [Pseudovibrio axinellae]